MQASNMLSGAELDRLCINTLRMLAVDAVQRAKSGHPGMPMGAAPMAYVLWTRILKHNPADPAWPDRDRFVLSAGHGSMLLYGLLHLTGYDLSLEDLRDFRQWGSRTPGHPEVGVVPGVEATTGPLGQGFANGVGMAMAERILAHRFNRPGHTIVDHYTYGIVSDGDLEEGISSEAASLAGTLKLGKLIYLYDDNRISIDGPTDLTFTEDVEARFRALGWDVQRVADENDLDAIEAAIRRAQAATEQPSLVMVRTTIAYGSPHKAGAATAHGEPLGEEEVQATKAVLGWPAQPPMFVPEAALARFRRALAEGRRQQDQWESRLAAYTEAFPQDAAEWRRRISGKLTRDWDKDLPSFRPEDGPLATRAASGRVLNVLAQRIEELIGGSADLSASNNTLIKGSADLSASDYGGRNLHFGVREHAMGAIANGMALHGGFIPYPGTFLVFSDYMRTPIRLAALSRLRVIFVFSHDSIGLGEDGPTHQPVEQLLALRAIPDLVVLRPADAVETVDAWKVALRRQGPTVLVLSRQGLPIFDRRTAARGAATSPHSDPLPGGEGVASATGVERGAYVLADAAGGPLEVILIATGSEVAPALAAHERLSTLGIAARVVSMPSWELFDRQPREYRDAVLPPTVGARVAVEAGVSMGWWRYVGDGGVVIGMDRFGASAPGQVLFERFGFTARNIVDQALRLLGR